MDQSRIGTFIMERRREKGLTQAQLAERLNITDRAVSKWETGKSLPDSSIMLSLCGILDITADELLRGSRTAEAARREPASAAPGASGRRFSLRTGGRRWISILLSGGVLTGTLVCFICDTACSGGFTWSLTAALSMAYGWVLLLPLTALENGGPTGSLAALSVFTLPYLYGLGRLLNVREVFPVGAVMTAVSVPFLWLVYAAFKRMGRTSAALGTAFLLLAGLAASANGALSLLGAAPPPGAWNWMGVLLLLLAAAVCFTRRRGGGNP